ncbi:hypothetical protein AB0I39_20325 [Kitasatospora purpeofusca]|uniref:hypothetical protein n=1 Tax=Kitasatospora purpeofusca TaxID=67352 RepID=UPI0033D7C6DB
MKRTNPRRAALAGSVALLAVGGLLAASAPAALALPPGPAATVVADRARAGTPAAHQVVTFFEAYRQAVLGASGDKPSEVRARFLTPALDRRLDAWAQEHDADPVFRAQNVPVDWSAQQVKEEYGFASVRLTEFWAGGDSQQVWFTVRVRDLKIAELGDQPAL